MPGNDHCGMSLDAYVPSFTCNYVYDEGCGHGPDLPLLLWGPQA